MEKEPSNTIKRFNPDFHPHLSFTPAAAAKLGERCNVKLVMLGVEAYCTCIYLNKVVLFACLHTYNVVILKCLFMSKVNKPPLSLSRLIQFMKGKESRLPSLLGLLR
ncbi:uncharacterized protein LOC120070688 [Benincasa hispida]|uniref:uncharacterized protein LOC120070688 n=1 Tax=Benincasa hispida TaxID=102211 RepID=UPI0019019A9A|nr:uncharacterized protein LOC120070688 [Benincasa hispida]